MTIIVTVITVTSHRKTVYNNYDYTQPVILRKCMRLPGIYLVRFPAMILDIRMQHSFVPTASFFTTSLFYSPNSTMDFEIRQCTIIQERNLSVFAENLPLSLPSKPMFLKNTSLTIRAETRASESTEILVLKPSIARPTVHHTKISLTWRAGERAFEPVPGGPIKKENGPFSRATGFFS